MRDLETSYIMNENGEMILVYWSYTENCWKPLFEMKGGELV